MMVWMFLLPALELLGLFLAALLNQEAARRFPRLKKFELVTLIVLWYAVLAVGGLVGEYI
jgi:hypothetical protein